MCLRIVLFCNSKNNIMKYIAYYRVSTKMQGKSGLGLAAQKEAVKNYIAPEDLLSEFTDIESGKNNNRVELKKAIELCKRFAATLVIAKLDRLSRNVTFISSLMDSKIKFVAVDMPQANDFTIHIFAALAQQERKMISERTRAGLKKSTKKKGFHNSVIRKAVLKNAETNCKKARSIHSENSKNNHNNMRAFALIKALRTSANTWSNIAIELNKSGYKTANNKNFQAVQVQRIFNKYSD